MVTVKHGKGMWRELGGRWTKTRHPQPCFGCAKLSIQFAIMEGNIEEVNLRGGEQQGAVLSPRAPLHWDLFLCTSTALTKRHPLSMERWDC